VKLSKTAYDKKLEKEKQITILALNWRDIQNPISGGAEVHAHEMFSRNSNEFQIVHLSPEFPECKQEEIIDGIRYIRKGNFATVIFYAMKYYIKNRAVIDLVIDQCNAHRFFTSFYVPQKKRIFYTHQLYRELWFVMAKPPISWLGYIAETPMLRLNRRDRTITVSDSTKQGLLDVGYKNENITIIPNGISFELTPYEQLSEKNEIPTFIYAGRYANSKGINYAVEAVGRLKKQGVRAQLQLLGRPHERYMEDVLEPICEEYGLNMGKNEQCDIIIRGFVTEEEKLRLLAKAHALVLPSTREGWGIVIIEAAVEGTPSIVYNSPGCVDAVNYGEAGYLCPNNCVDEIVQNMLSVINDAGRYETMRKKAYEFSKQFQWDRSAKKFEKLIMDINGQ
jgi:glycosyltransferase involved in cell wall biosynthesis